MMETKVYSSVYKGISCLIIENDWLLGIFLPSQGAKLASLIYKPTGKEFILQSAYEEYPLSKYGQSYLLGDCAGVDEMFPNIDQCYYDEYPWEGIPLPDHGEVWAIPWQYTIAEDQISFFVHGVRLPYILSKKVKLNGCSMKSFYELENLSDFQMHFVWASHMMLTSEKNCKFRFPDGLGKGYTTMSDSQTIGVYGDTFAFPIIQKPDGSEYDIRIHRGPKGDDYQKFYFADKLKEGWSEISYPDGHQLRIDFPPEKVPYMGVIQAEGGNFNINCMFLEPCTGAFDRPDIARLHNMNSVLGEREVRKWHLYIGVNKRVL